MRPVGLGALGIEQYNAQALRNSGIRPEDKTQKSEEGSPSGINRFVKQSNRESTLISKFDEKLLKRLEILECQTCSSRRYQDGSDDPGVSFKSPTHISPEMSGTMVAAHENEHVVRETAAAESEGRKVISQSVRLFSDVCPECGKTYISGGETKTTTAAKNGPDISEEFIGNLVDLKL